MISRGGHWVLKIYSASKHEPSQSREVIAAKVFKKARGYHPGWRHIRLCLDSFQILGPGGRHVCLIYEPQGESILSFRDHFPDKMLSKSLLQRTLRCTLQALDIMDQACIVHARQYNTALEYSFPLPASVDG